jgi:hypothetical protein
MAALRWDDLDGFAWAPPVTHGYIDAQPLRLVHSRCGPGHPRVRRPRYLARRLLVLGALAGLGTAAWSAVQGLAPAGAASAPQIYVARPGDTAWSIAVRYSRGGDPRSLVARLEAQIGDGVLQPGERLSVP